MRLQGNGTGHDMGEDSERGLFCKSLTHVNSKFADGSGSELDIEYPKLALDEEEEEDVYDNDYDGDVNRIKYIY